MPQLSQLLKNHQNFKSANEILKYLTTSLEGPILLEYFKQT